jgi:hypothetical protein
LRVTGVNQDVTRFLLCLSLALVAAIATQLLATRYVPLAERLLWENWGDLIVFGAICGALVGNLCWVALKVAERVTRATLVCVVANVLVWIAFLVFNPPLTKAEWAEMTRPPEQDAHAAAQGAGLDIVDDAPLVVAGRWSGTFGSVSTSDYFLGLFAGPPVTFAWLLVVPPRYPTSYRSTTEGESYVVAGVGFVLSTAFWVAFGGGISALRRAFQRRRSAGKIAGGTEVAPHAGMDEQGDDTRGAQRESPHEREQKRNPAEKQDVNKPAEGRDVPPSDDVKKGKRDPKSPWMGGG